MITEVDKNPLDLRAQKDAKIPRAPCTKGKTGTTFEFFEKVSVFCHGGSTYQFVYWRKRELRVKIKSSNIHSRNTLNQWQVMEADSATIDTKQRLAEKKLITRLDDDNQFWVVIYVQVIRKTWSKFQWCFRFLLGFKKSQKGEYCFWFNFNGFSSFLVEFRAWDVEDGWSKARGRLQRLELAAY